ncbi:steroid delta-isomerase [Roseiarcus fermentans]|uniref:Steroid delta-isomerase n=1 Tax=Roseiarcus fermentans TaxID=1473586 RepID=A0A366EK11_9HYPH|nr:nuclear transport factor 2 family protein [Roseiarcus fermentans]RBP02698.1 steroid delta-isomerase [Roseiarcus fermentans]
MRRPASIARYALVALFAATLAPMLAFADPEADKAAIAARLETWAAAFNAHDAAAACDIFAPDLVATVRGAPERGRDAVCAGIASALADRTRTLRYVPDIREILVSGDLAVVRLAWSLTVARGPVPALQKEPGLDVFRRGPDGRWRIIRFLAYSNAPD